MGDVIMCMCACLTRVYVDVLWEIARCLDMVVHNN
jgi:hypothetical protein